MNLEKRVSIHWVKAILASANALNIETQDILSHLGIELNLEANQPAYLSLAQTQIIWHQAEKLSGHQHFGLMMGQAFRPSFFHVVAYLAMTSQNLKQAYEHFITYLPLITEAAELSLHHEKQQVCIIFTPQEDLIPFSRHQYESALTLLLTFTRWLVGDKSLSPKRVSFQHSKGPDLALYEEVFSVEPDFNQTQTCIYFPNHILTLPLVDSDLSLNQLHLSHAQSLLSHHLTRSWQEMTLFSIAKVGIKEATKEHIAQQLNVSPRTLQRRLNEEQTSFKLLLDLFKKEHALKLIQDSNLAFKRIATELGFAESSTFYRAVNRWFNMTPQAIRQLAFHDEAINTTSEKVPSN